MLMLNNNSSKTIRSLRLQKGLGQNELATRAGVSLKELRLWEKGLSVPDEALLCSIANILEVTSDEIREAHMASNISPGEGYTTATPAESFINAPTKKLRHGVPTIIDLFSGTGGFSHGFEMTNQFQVALGLDLLPDRVNTFRSNHPSAWAVCGDIRTCSAPHLMEQLPHPEGVIGGPPCQGFSSLRPFRALTENDIRNNLFLSFANFIDKTRPKWFVMENVVGLLTHKKGETLRSIVSVFESIGFAVSWRILNAACFGLPQRRERLIVVGSLKKMKFRWPEPSHYVDCRSMAGKRHEYDSQLALFGSSLVPAISVMDAIHDLPSLQAGESSDKYRDNLILTDYEKEMRLGATRLTLHQATMHSPHMLEIIRHAGSNRSALPAGMTSSGFSSCYSRLEADIPSVTLTVNFVHPSSNKCIHPYQDRALTPREGARLQGFPDKYEFWGNRAQVVKQIGNAVPPLLGRIIAESILASF